MYIKNRTEWALAALRAAGLNDGSASSTFEKRVYASIAGLMREFFSRTHTPISAEFVLGLFGRLARGEPLTEEFLRCHKSRLQEVAEEKEQNAWLADRYNISPGDAERAVRVTRSRKADDDSQIRLAADSYGFTAPDKPTPSIMDDYGVVYADSKPTPSIMDDYGVVYADSKPNDETKADDEKSAAKQEEKDMCLPDTDLTRAVRGVIEKFCDDLSPFTGLDVSNAVKRAGRAVRHREVAPIVREMYGDGDFDRFGYERSLIQVSLPGGRQAQAWLYHHQTDSADNYDTRAQVALPPKQNAAQDDGELTYEVKKADGGKDKPAATTVVHAAPLPGDSHVSMPSVRTGGGSRMLNTNQRQQKLDGRLEIPRRWIRQLGWTWGDHVVALRDGDAILLRKDVDADNKEVVYRFVVDRWNRIRVTNRALSKVNRNFGHGAQHTVTLQAGGIKVE